MHTDYLGILLSQLLYRNLFPLDTVYSHLLQAILSSHIFKQISFSLQSSSESSICRSLLSKCNNDYSPIWKLCFAIFWIWLQWDAYLIGLDCTIIIIILLYDPSINYVHLRFLKWYLRQGKQHRFILDKSVDFCLCFVVQQILIFLVRVEVSAQKVKQRSELRKTILMLQIWSIHPYWVVKPNFISCSMFLLPNNLEEKNWQHTPKCICVLRRAQQFCFVFVFFLEPY